MVEISVTDGSFPAFVVRKLLNHHPRTCRAMLTGTTPRKSTGATENRSCRSLKYAEGFHSALV